MGGGGKEEYKEMDEKVHVWMFFLEGGGKVWVKRDGWEGSSLNVLLEEGRKCLSGFGLWRVVTLIWKSFKLIVKFYAYISIYLFFYKIKKWPMWNEGGIYLMDIIFPNFELHFFKLNWSVLTPSWLFY